MRSEAVNEAASITAWHAHIYYDAKDPESRARASLLRERVRARFPVRMGSWHDAPVGPHPNAMYQIAFSPELFPTVVPFLMLNRAGLTVLLHPETGHPRADHTLHAAWFGAPLSLRTEALPETAR